MISRRALLGTGAGVALVAGAAGYAEHSHRLDDLARGIGLKPRPRPAAADQALLASVRRDQSALLLSARATAQSDAALAARLAPLIANLGSQIEELGGIAPAAVARPLPAGSAPALEAIRGQLTKAQADRSHDAMRAISGELAQVLGSISAGLAQNLAALKKA